MSKIYELLEILKGIEEDIIEYTSANDESDAYIECELASDLMYELLITDSGACDWDNINLLRNSGYSVYPGDQDSFGWLVGCIDTNKGTITFG